MDEGSKVKVDITTHTIAELYIKQGYVEKAIDIYRAILELDPGNEAATVKLRLLQGGVEKPVIAVPTEDEGITGEENSAAAQIARLEGWSQHIRKVRKGAGETTVSNLQAEPMVVPAAQAALPREAAGLPEGEKSTESQIARLEGWLQEIRIIRRGGIK